MNGGPGYGFARTVFPGAPFKKGEAIAWLIPITS
jgi:hypothetical protein